MSNSIPVSDYTIPGAVPLLDWLDTIRRLTKREKERIVDQALTLIDDLYVHLPLKRAMHAVDPIQRLKLIKYRLSRMDEWGFQSEMISTFMGLRDLHTNYILPDPYRGATAFLPFLIEEFSQDNEPQYMVSKVFHGFDHPSFREGAILTHWSGIPVERAVRLNAERNAGSNEDARLAQGLERLTIRPLMMSLPPDEEWVDIRYISSGQVHELRFGWQVLPPVPTATGSALDSAEERIQAAIGIDVQTEVARRIKKALFVPKAMALEKEMAKYQLERAAAAAGGPELEPDIGAASLMPDVFVFRTVHTQHGRFGYIRIYTFNVDDADEFVGEFVRIAGQLPQDGLIIDVRSNGGGYITAGEKLLQVLTPNKIEPERLHFINTPLTLELAERHEWIAQWAPSISMSIETGSIFSQGFPIEPAAEYNRIGQQYHGRVILITDALCYSTTDIFAAGFQDHDIGPILGTSGNTGAGGANVWTHELLRRLLPASSPIKSLPKNASFRVAIRRTTRVGARAGLPLEDLGVEPDAIHRMTRNDLLDGNVDLIERAAEMLVSQ